MAQKQLKMSTGKYVKIGELRIVDGDVSVKQGYFDDGLAFGRIFKDEEIYRLNWDAVCYVPEQGFSGIPDDEGFYHNFDGFTHNDLLRICNGNRELCDALFDDLKWAYPSTYAFEWEDQDIAYYYRFIVPGAKVWWNDPAGETSGEYEVYESPFEWDERGELVNADEIGLDAVILIGNGYSEAEVFATELTPIYPKES